MSNGSQTPIMVSADRYRMEQVFTNLFQNAIDAVGEDGTVECTLQVTEDQAFTEVTIVDDGPGIDQQQREQMFEHFFTTKTKGTGLGLPITMRILDAHQAILCRCGSSML